MNIRCEQLDDLLLEGDSLSMTAAERHAGGCAACRERLDDWLEISATARGMRAEWKSDLLWPRIHRAIQTEKRRHIAALWRVAAVVLLTAGLAGGGWMIVRDASRDAAFDQRILQVEALDQVERAEQAHLQAIERLESLTASKLEQPQAPLMVSYKEKLMMLDDAIAECEAIIQSNRQNAYLRKQLLAMYSEKQKTLREVMGESDAIANR